MDYSQKFLIIFLIIIVGFVVSWEIPEFRFFITGRVATPSAPGTTANVTVYGTLGDIEVYFNPVNFTSSDVGEAPGSTYKKVNAGGVGYIRVNMSANNNMEWDIYINASDLSDGAGNTIPVENISVNSTCNVKSTPVTLIPLSTNLKHICYETDTPESDIQPHAYADIEFYLYVPAGQYNNTYFGNIWIYVNHTGTDPTGDNRTWYGPNNITIKVKQFIEITWSLVPIQFPSLAPNTKSNATDNEGFPANVTNTAVTNVFIDLYLNGTNLDCLSGGCSIGTDYIGVGNVSYSNATSLATWPDNIKDLALLFPSQGNTFDNWQHVKNNTDIFNYWNISIPQAQPGGDYGGYVNAKAVEEGQTA